jgi:N-acetyl-anhydromuramyl-L-alanine amidase AmpD
MDKGEAKEILEQLRAYTIQVSKFLGVEPIQSGKNSYGPFADGQPTGAITHYTASNMAVTRNRPYGRLPVLLNRFAPGGTQKVGVHFIVWDEKVERFNEFRDRFDLLKDMPGEVFFMGDTEAYWHAGWFNKISYGVEIRNLGNIIKDGRGRFFWRNGAKYFGRDPIKVGFRRKGKAYRRSFWEPYTWQQMAATLWVHRLMASIYPIRPERFLGHSHVSSTRIDPGLHFPIHEMREYSLDKVKRNIPINKVPWLSEFEDDPYIYDRIDLPPEWGQLSESALNKGLYRHDWDGRPEEFQLEENVVDFGEFIKIASGPTEPDAQAWEDLRSLGYFPGVDAYSDEYKETVRIFQSRWKKRRPSGRGFFQTMKATGELCEDTKNLIKRYICMMDIIQTMV